MPEPLRSEAMAERWAESHPSPDSQPCRSTR
ncbi:hypothetical protein [Sphingomonas sp. LT1P40]